MRARYAAMFAFFLALAVVHALVAFWAPVQGDDWNHWIWAGQHRDDDGWLLAWLASHFTFSDAIGYVLARHVSVHVVLTPMVIVALVIGLFTIAMRRTPRATFDDLLALATVSALFWIGQPAAGVTLFHTPHLADYVYGAAAAVWFIAPWRCGWQVPRAAWPLLAIGGYCAGSSSRAIGLAALVGVIAMIRAVPRDRRETWMWIALAGLVVGVAAGYASPPWIEFGRVFRRGLEQNLTGPGLLRFALQETGEIVALVSAFVTGNLVLGVFGWTRADDRARPEPADTLRWLVGSFAVAVWCLFGPRYNEAALVPVTCMLSIAALPYLMWLATARPLRILLIAIAIGVHAIAWTKALVIYHDIGEQGVARMAALRAAKPGTIVRVPHYSQIPQSFWFYGEDLGAARLRALVAIEAFGLRDIVLDHFRRLELNPGIELALEVEGATAAELSAARPPAVWAGELSAARKQFELFVKRLRAQSKTANARLVVKNVEFEQRGTRPLLAAWVDGKQRAIPRVARSTLDAHSRYTVRIYGAHAKLFDEAFIIENGRAEPTEYRKGSPRLQPRTQDLNVVVVCNHERCFAADAFVPRF